MSVNEFKLSQFVYFIVELFSVSNYQLNSLQLKFQMVNIEKSHDLFILNQRWSKVCNT